MSPDVLLAACRFVHDSSLMALWGTSAYLAVLVPQSVAEPVAGRLTIFRLAAVSLTLGTTCLTLPTQTAMIGDGWSDAVNGQMLWDVLASTNIGTAWLAQALAGVLLVATQMIAPRLRLATTAIASGLGLVCLALSGHAVMNEGWRGIVHPLNDALHVLSAGAWVGALLPLLLILASASKAPFDADAATALRRFSNAGHVVVTLAILSGIANSFFIVGWPFGLSSPYRMLLSMKVVAVLAMIAMATANRYWFVPRIGRAHSTALHAIRVGTAIEIVLALAAILFVSIFGMLDPNS
ncbi:copper homeostasis membrane protein CopD [Mesorhizobium sp. BH1-1-5]|uniref:copper homeostasis membrane protein CopD n=1 Tax=Mesorhizobium sp. BH1-1-5 TaxID=2876661 RepID=UPI001CCD808E|nr:copper homeostasis membrane protein CopD [Mesorhizobium sp. BH1-1-5]MBZ9989528.1 copper homeostasis membrane protein CopD [Mesorhizobium sp. BH1-1-5]